MDKLLEETDGIWRQVDKLQRVEALWQLLLDLVNQKLLLEVKHPPLVDGPNQHLWEWWLRLLLLAKVDLELLRVQHKAVAGTKNQDKLL